MDIERINELGEIVGTRMTVFNLLPDFLDPAKTEGWLCEMYGLTAEQIAAARAFILQHLDTVLPTHLELEKRIAAGNAPEMMEKAKNTRAAFLYFKQLLADREQLESTAARNGAKAIPAFREWLAERQGSVAEGS
jgi:uncharacterized protein (DUF433 family)